MRLAAALFIMTALASGAAAQDWSQWRGPNRDGVVAAKSVPLSWPESFKTRWRVEVGEGFSAPVASGYRVYVHSRRDPEEMVTAIDRETGKVVWQKTYAAPYEKNQYAAKMAKGPHATPLIAEGRLFTLGVSGILSAWDATSGELLWRKDFSDSHSSSRLFCGTSVSPLMEAGKLIVQVGSDVHQGRILALDPATGKEHWTWRGAGPGYASPIAITAGSVRQIVTLTNGYAVGIHSGTGESLWTINFPDEWHENIVTPIWTGKHLIISGTRQGTHAYTLRQKDNQWEVTPAWKNTDAPMYMSTPVVAEGILYGLSSKKRGYFFAMDTANGKIRWATEGREGDQASVLLTPTHVVYLTSDGSLIVARRTPEKYDAAHRYQIAESQTWAMPVLLADGLIVRDATGIFRAGAD